MTANGCLQLGLYLVVLLALAKPLGAYMAARLRGRPGCANAFGAPVERAASTALAGVDAGARDGLDATTRSRCCCSTCSACLRVYALQRLQGVLPLNPAGLGAVSPDSSFNTAVSFATNTNWQGYGGETTMSYLTQMLGARPCRTSSRRRRAWRCWSR